MNLMEARALACPPAPATGHRSGMDDLVASVGRISVAAQLSADRRGGASQLPGHGSLALPVHLHVSDPLPLVVVQLSIIHAQGKPVPSEFSSPSVALSL